MYHTVSYLLMSGRVTKEKSPSPPPPNEVAAYLNKGFDNWHVGRAWVYYVHLFYKKLEEKRILKEKRKCGGEENAESIR